MLVLYLSDSRRVCPGTCIVVFTRGFGDTRLFSVSTAMTALCGLRASRGRHESFTAGLASLRASLLVVADLLVESCRVPPRVRFFLNLTPAIRDV